MVREKSRHARHLSEFELIERFFTHRARAQPERAAAIDNAEAPPRRPLKTALGIGDDCALINDTDDAQLAISTDMLVEGRHFFSNVDPRARAMMSGYPAGSAMRGWRSADGAVNGRLRIALGRAFSARSTGRSRGLRLAARSPELRTQRLICPTDSRAI